ncbi:hypothetical protein QJS04_geneDACA011418 [Acorus gramineus]|uniref:ubiquitinyl hydrolase 1 n=1 Tax=Acorus gramineus TaxID=55184 RepID=A0AAV9ALS2_ACOGR|nr:hypothetical protein QJS04_geneDACA011418 [Acorus gramineus]
MMLYHEAHQSKLRVVHCINAVLQGPVFSDPDLIDLASSFSKTDPTLPSFDDDIDFSHIISLGGPFSLKVLKAALEVWGLQIVPMEPALDLENAFVCHSLGQWVCVRRVGGEWYSFDGAHDVPKRLPGIGLAAHLNDLLNDSWTIYAVRGDLPSECPVSSNRYGKWVPPEDAQGAKKSLEEMSSSPERFGSRGYEEDLKTTMAASLWDLKPAKGQQKSIMNVEEELLKALLAASSRDLGLGVFGEPAEAEEKSIEPAEAGDESEKARDGDDGLGGS